MNRVDGRFAAPALADHFAVDRFLTPTNAGGEFFTQIKIAADAFAVGTTEPEHGLGVGEINHVLDLTGSGVAFGGIILENCRQRLQLPKRVGKRG